MTQKNYCIISGVLFCLVALAHLLRIINGTSVHVDEYVVPMAVSWVGFIVPAGWSFVALRISGRS